MRVWLSLCQTAPPVYDSQRRQQPKQRQHTAVRDEQWFTSCKYGNDRHTQLRSERRCDGRDSEQRHVSDTNPEEEHFTFNLFCYLLLSSSTRPYRKLPHMFFIYCGVTCIFTAFVYLIYDVQGRCLRTVLWMWVAWLRLSWPTRLSSAQSSVLSTLCAPEMLDLTKQRFPATIYSPEPKNAGERAE